MIVLDVALSSWFHMDGCKGDHWWTLGSINGFPGSQPCPPLLTLGCAIVNGKAL